MDVAKLVLSLELAFHFAVREGTFSSLRSLWALAGDLLGRISSPLRLFHESGSIALPVRRLSTLAAGTLG